MSDELKEWQFNLNDIRPTIRNGMWWIGEVNTGVSADGLPGEPGEDGQPGESTYISNVSTNAQGGKVILFSDGTTVIIPKGEKGDKGDPGRDADPASSTDTLGDVNNRGNSTNKSIFVHDAETNRKTEQTFRGLNISDSQGAIGAVTGARDDKAGIYLSMSLGGFLRFRIKEETSAQAGAHFETRVSGREAVNSRDFITLSQLNRANPEIAESPEHTLQQNKDVLIVTSNNATIELPDVHHSEAEEWSGRKFKIVAHREVATSKPYINLTGAEIMKITEGTSVELMYLNNNWYAI